MAEGSTPFLHPSLQKRAVVYRRRLRLLSLWLFLGMGGLLLVAMVSALTGQTLGDLLTLGLIGLLLIPAVTLAGGLMWYVDRRSSRKLGVANQLLLNGLPRTVRLMPMKPACTGRLVALQSPVEGPIYAVFERFARPLSPQGMEVQLYSHHLTRGNELVVLAADGTVLLGTRVDRKAYERRMKLLAIVLVIVAALMVIGVFTR
ncbi:MAG: hypothetical protein IPP10_06395 [Candidatus Competibacteraceae bacterium]|nr:hypothetical protein [Candidatus Competibacteraceae bacterium]MBK9951152.1 hypothetical protein [Candidatus Competibacteraceae bacterium]